METKKSPLCPIKELVEKGEDCTKAIHRLKEKGVRGERLDHEKCPWYIDSKEYKYCFWLYMNDDRNKKERQLTEIANLLGTSVNNIKLIETGAFSKIKDSLTHLTT